VEPSSSFAGSLGRREQQRRDNPDHPPWDGSGQLDTQSSNGEVAAADILYGKDQAGAIRTSGSARGARNNTPLLGGLPLIFQSNSVLLFYYYLRNE